MPIYKYTCQKCGKKFKRLVKVGNNGDGDDKPVCPDCGSSDVNKEVPNIGIRFKGSGFYKTDYKGNGNSGSSTASTSSGSNSEE